MIMAVDEKNVFRGKYGGIYINGYDLISIKKGDLKEKVTNEEVSGTGHRAGIKQYVLKDVTSTSAIEVARTDNMGLKEFHENIINGINPTLLIEMYSEDPNQYEGQIEKVSFDGTIEGDVDLFAIEDGKQGTFSLGLNVNPKSIKFESIVDGGKQDMLTK